MAVYPAHDYKGRSHSTIEAELASNPRLQQRDRAAFVAMMQGLNLSSPKHLTEALRVNMTGGKSVAQMLERGGRHRAVHVAGRAAPAARRRRSPTCVVLDVRERDAYEAGHVPGAMLLPRGQLELRVNDALPDPTVRIVVCCEFGRISTLAASDAAHDGLPARRGARRRPAGLARGGLSGAHRC